METKTAATQRVDATADGVKRPAKGQRPPAMTVIPVGSFLINNPGRMQRYPDMVRLRLGIRDFYLVTNPSLIQEVLVTRQREFIKGEFLQNTKKVFGEGLLTSEGEFHHRQMRLVQPAFHSERIGAYVDTITAHERRLTATWRDGETLDVHDEMTRLTMSIIAQCLFDIDLGSRSASISNDLALIIGYFNRLSSPSPESSRDCPATGSIWQPSGAPMPSSTT